MVPLIEALKNKTADVQEKPLEALGEIGDVRALEPLIQFLEVNRALPPESWQKVVAEKALEKICRKIPTEDRYFFCKDCCCRTQRYKLKLSLIRNIHYYACRKCHSNSYLLTGIKKVVLLLDHHFEEVSVQDGGTLRVNWYKRKVPFDFDEIRIKDADDYEVEELVMKLRNDMDKKRRKRLPKKPVYLSPNLKLSQAKMNLLKDNLQVKIKGI